VEQTHTVRAIEALIDRTEEGLEAHIAERTDAMDAFFDGLRDRRNRSVRKKTAEELAALIRLPLRLTGEQSRQLADDPDEFKKWLEEYLESQLVALNVTRVVGRHRTPAGRAFGRQKSPPRIGTRRLRRSRASRVNSWNASGERLTSQSSATLKFYCNGNRARTIHPNYDC